ncbi:MAG: FtsQ-type POTRA domain-containing protein [Anaerolineae bacterium]|nr:MAG: FtsQ-type POTRA domain-containing protein [Anaerolineae bacterium]
MTPAERRSDRIRQRRAARSAKKPARRVAARKQHTPLPAVVVRGGMPGVSATTTRRKVRRRIDLPLRNGAELSVAGIPLITPGWRLLSAALSILLALSLLWLWNAAAYRVDTVELIGAERVTPADVLTLIPLRGTPVFAVDVRMLRAQVQAAFPELASPQIHIGFPARVRIQAVERQPVLVWIQDGRTTWVDMQGIGFPPRGEAPDLIEVHAETAPPLGESPLPGQVLPSDVVAACLQVGRLAPQGAPLVFSREHGLGWQDPLGWQVYFGMHLDDITEKLRTYAALVQYLQTNDIHPVFVSLEYSRAPYYRLAP